MALSQTVFALPDFVASFGDLTAEGTISLTADHQINGDIQAGTLALPPPPADLTPLWSALSGASGKILLSANRVLLAGTPLLGQSNGSLTLQPDSDRFSLANARLAGGTLTADITATTAPATPPSLEAKLSLTSADAAQLALPFAFPLTIQTGTIALQANLTAAGYGPHAWAATLAGPASLAAKSGTLAGFNLPAAVQGLTALPRNTALIDACLSGSTPFDTISAAGALDHGIYTITAASLQSPSGTATAAGKIDLPDQDLSLNLSLLPNVTTPPTIGLALDGAWAKPQKTAATRDALAWTAVGVSK